MHPLEVRRHLREPPFKPVRLFMSDGSTYDVPDREYTYVSRREVIVALEIGPDGLPRRSAYLDPVHITRIEPLVNGDTAMPDNG